MRTIIFIILAIVSSSAYAQLKVIETSVKTPITLDLSKQPIVDINGTLRVEIDIKTLAAKIGSRSNPAQAKRLEGMVQLLKSEKEILNVLKPAVAGAAADITQLNAYSALMIDFFTAVMNDPEMRERVNTLYDQAGALSRSGKLDLNEYPTQDTYVIKNLSNEMNSLVDEIKSSPEAGGTSIQMVAFLTTKTESDRRVHIKNFDEFSEGNFFEVPRWVTSFSEDDIKKFDEMSQLSKDLNRQIENNFADLKKLIPTTFESIDCFNKLIVKINQDAATATGEVKTFLDNSEQKINAVLQSAQNILLQKENTGVNALEGFNQAQKEFIALAKTLATDVRALEASLTNTGKTGVASITTDFTACVATLNSDLDKVTKIFNVVHNLLTPFKQTATSAGEASDEAFSFTLDKLPAFGIIELKTTGTRENGSEIKINLVTKTAEQIKNRASGEIIDYASITLQQINFYTESNIGVIVAVPFNRSKDVTLPGAVQFAPSGSLLMKFGSRKSPLWNAINPGIGFNISTPDFNIDGTPDISYGAAITLFRNVLTSGMSYNTKTDSPFWFVGLSLPFASLGLPIGGNVETQKIK